jgi:head-tail adaptor
VNLGTLNRMVELRRDVTTGTDAYGQPIVTEQTVRRFWAAKIFKSEDEKVAAAAVYSVRLVTFRAHHFDGLEQTDRLVCEGETFNVLGWRELGLRAGLEITARSVT